MVNLYQEWSLDQDQLLWTNKEKSPAELASLLGRGLRGVQARLSKLQDMSSPAYERLFTVIDNKNKNPLEEPATKKEKVKLIPAGEVLRRIEWDYMLQASDFSFLHYDRMEDTIVESPMDAPNAGISGKEVLLAKALPEHRIVGIKYKDRVVWDRTARLDLVFSGEEGGIYQIIEGYDEWKAEHDKVQAWNRERHEQATQRMRQILGLEVHAQLERLSSDLLEASRDPAVPTTQSEVETYVQRVLELFRTTRQDPTQSLEPSLIPMSDYLAMDEFSELISVLPDDAELRGRLLSEISRVMDKFNKQQAPVSSTTATTKMDVELLDNEVTETFVRGSGPGGQKINKTSNRVLLVHEPTQLRVECQDTRSLQQNRKIARKRLKEKLDEYLNGSLSKVGMKQQKASQKRQKVKTKNRSRQRKKQSEKQLEQEDEEPPVATDVEDFY
jgi:uncharacterized protein (UPF0248 family)